MVKSLLIDDMLPTVAARMRADALVGTVPAPAYQVSALAAIRGIIQADWPRGNSKLLVKLVMSVLDEVDRLDAASTLSDPGE